MNRHAAPAEPILTGYTKAIVAIIAAALAAVASAITDNTVTPLELAVILIAVITAVNVYLVPNLPEGSAVHRHAKAAVAFLGAALALLVTTLGADGGWASVTASEWLLVILAGLGGIGVTVLPNTPVEPDLAI